MQYNQKQFKYASDATGFLSLSTFLGVSSLVTSIGSATASTFGVIEGLSIEKERFKLQEEIALRQLSLQEMIKAKELQLLDVQISGAQAIQEIQIEVGEAQAGAQIAVAGRTELEAQLMAELVSLKIQSEIIEEKKRLVSITTPQTLSVSQNGNGGVVSPIVKASTEKKLPVLPLAVAAGAGLALFFAFRR